MKYKLLQKLPWLEIGMILDELQDIHPYSVEWYVSSVFAKQYPDFFEEVKEPKTIYDLKEWDNYWYLCSMNSVWKQNCMSSIKDDYKTSIFLTELEAKRNKLLRELATREKWLPKYWERYINQHSDVNHWDDDECEIMWYHMWLVFRNEEEYNKYITEDVKDLLFNI